MILMYSLWGLVEHVTKLRFFGLCTKKKKKYFEPWNWPTDPTLIHTDVWMVLPFTAPLPGDLFSFSLMYDEGYLGLC